MEKFEFAVSPEHDEKRIDSVLAQVYSEYSRSDWSRQLTAKEILIGKKTAKAADRVHLGERISGSFPTPSSNLELIKPSHIPELIYEDENVIVINKPPGLSVHPSAVKAQPTLAAIYQSEIDDDDPIRPGIVHRLDKDTSGVMILARNLVTKKFLQAQFANRTVTKTYLALVWGHLKEEAAKIDLPINRHKQSPAKMVVSSHGKSALTQYKLLREYLHYTLVQAQPKTGRTHQIRVHFAHIGHPVVGDKLYDNHPMPAGLQRQFLHASTLQIEIPRAGIKTFQANLPVDLQTFLDSL